MPNTPLTIDPQELRELALYLSQEHFHSAEATAWGYELAATVLSSPFFAEKLRAVQEVAWDSGYQRAEEDHYGTGFWSEGRRGNPHQVLPEA
jgi:hypothetical protein